jgi:endonuclease YncB( thermonuclease family)
MVVRERLVARLYVGDLDVSQEMMKRGAAWFNTEYASDNSLFNVEEDARDAKVGLWALPKESRMEPWEWRWRARKR